MAAGPGRFSLRIPACLHLVALSRKTSAKNLDCTRKQGESITTPSTTAARKLTFSSFPIFAGQHGVAEVGTLLCSDAFSPCTGCTLSACKPGVAECLCASALASRKALGLKKRPGREKAERRIPNDRLQTTKSWWRGKAAPARRSDALLMSPYPSRYISMCAPHPILSLSHSAGPLRAAQRLHSPSGHPTAEAASSVVSKQTRSPSYSADLGRCAIPPRP